MKKFLIALPLILFFTACSSQSAQEAGNRYVNGLYINNSPNQYPVSETYQEKDGQAIVLSITCDLDRNGTIPAVEFLITSLEKGDGWEVSFGPEVYNPKKELPMIADSNNPSTRKNVWDFSKNLLEQLPKSCQDKYFRPKN